MSNAMIGALVGAALGIVSFAVLRLAAARIEASGSAADVGRRAGLVRAIAVFDLLLFPVLGFFVAPTVFG